ncbi:MAG TPA: NAD(P)/FAD-dependent oxidoreductase [Cyclobacteriaceae bacterium]|nr:NAD(P)/FAD-dependent oxidoreductase [Cyclobacteriaceae bacterium]
MTKFDVIIIGGSYAGLAAGMGLGRALRSVLIVDSGLPSNRFTPQSHNFLTHDGRKPAEIGSIAKSQVDQYDTVERIDGLAVSAERSGNEFLVTLDDGTKCQATKLVFATGIIDMLPDIPGFADCWGKSVLHCPYCHGYEVRDVKTGILGNGDYAYEFGALISNWTSDLTIYTNGPSTLSAEQQGKLKLHGIDVVHDTIKELRHTDGYIESIEFCNGNTVSIKALYSKPGFSQHSDIPRSLGCEISNDGYIRIDSGLRTTVPGVYACGDNVTRLRTVANAIAMGTTTAITLNKDMILESF